MTEVEQQAAFLEVFAGVDYVSERDAIKFREGWAKLIASFRTDGLKTSAFQILHLKAELKKQLTFLVSEKKTLESEVQRIESAAIKFGRATAEGTAAFLSRLAAHSEKIDRLETAKLSLFNSHALERARRQNAEHIIKEAEKGSELSYFDLNDLRKLIQEIKVALHAK